MGFFDLWAVAIGLLVGALASVPVAIGMILVIRRAQAR